MKPTRLQLVIGALALFSLSFLAGCGSKSEPEQPQTPEQKQQLELEHKNKRGDE